MAQTPLTLSMMTLAYGGKAPEDCHRINHYRATRLLLDTYVGTHDAAHGQARAGLQFD